MVHQNFVTIDDMRGTLLTMDQVRERLSATEPLSPIDFNATNARMRYEDGWHAVGQTDYTGAYLQLPGGHEYQLTKQGALQVGAVCHMPRGLQEQTPPDVLAPFINYWLSQGLGDRELKALARNDQVLAITRATVSPFSNLRLLDTILTRIANRYGEGEVLADYKFHHDLEATALRLIIPGQERVITGSSVADDTWSVGVDLRNSIVGLRQTDLRGYLFRYWCTNGCIDTIHASGAFSRRGATEDDAVAWAAETVDEVLGGLEPMLDHVQELTGQPVAGDVRDMLDGLFNDFGIASRDRRRVIEEMADDSEMTAYSLMQAITRAANLDGLDHRSVDRLMTLGGHFAGSRSERCNMGRVHRVHADGPADAHAVLAAAVESAAADSSIVTDIEPVE